MYYSRIYRHHHHPGTRTRAQPHASSTRGIKTRREWEMTTGTQGVSQKQMSRRSQAPGVKVYI